MRLRYAFFLLALLVGGCEAAPSSPLVGAWRDASDDAFTRQYTFSPDGGLEIALRRPAPLADTAFAATYAVERDSVLTLADAKGSEQFIVHVIGDTLELRDAEGFSARFFRLPDRP